jgi:hypothetical protein
MAEEELGWKALSWAGDHWDEIWERLSRSVVETAKPHLSSDIRKPVGWRCRPVH